MQGIEVCSMRNESPVIANINKILTKYLTEVIEILLKDFVFEWLFLNFPNFLPWTVYPSMVYSNKSSAATVCFTLNAWEIP